LEAASQLRAAAGILAPYASTLPAIDEQSLTITAPILAGTRVVELVRTLDEVGIDVADINRRQATLDDVFLSLTR
jgi:hypothetical protein